ncbi:hypothetical protein FH972_009160 [Carpinus fangiana]|uniref:protein-disulfide reductase n=1 Tax=Carpinus fangiana TaxID=176857 RepID=A0A5N6R2M0_9ROSI|nr:hypothetical protein FH972_009160 [Carpinus fangiana]
MAGGEQIVTQFNDGDALDCRSLLSSSERDFLVRNNGDQVKIDSLKGKKLWLYFSASWCRPSRHFTPSLVEAHKELSTKGDFEIIFISADKDEEWFDEYLSKMPWLAIPFSDSEKRDLLNEEFKVRGIPTLVIIGEDGKVVPVSELEGKTVGLYFSVFSSKACGDFTPMLIDIYEKLKTKGEGFEVLLMPLDEEEESFNQGFRNMPWFSLPVKDKGCEKLVRYFELSTLPTVVIIGPDGKTLHSNVAEAIKEHGVLAYPFTPEKFAELAEAQTLESVLVSGDRDFVIGKNGAKIPVSDLVGKNILIYYSARWCPPCVTFLPKLIEAYHKIKAKDDAFEVIFISCDNYQASFDEFFSRMPWLALPFGDSRKASLSRTFKVSGIPGVVAIGPSGRTVTTEARDLIIKHGANAYPFTDERVKEIEAEFEEIAKGEVAGPITVMSVDLEEDKDDSMGGGENPKEGWVCDGEVCSKA